MKTIIGRTLFWFQDREEKLRNLDDRFFPLGNFLNRLLSEVYHGKKIRFLNLYFKTEGTYKLFPDMPKYYCRFSGGHFTYFDVFDIEVFNKLETNEQKRFIWEIAYKSLREASIKAKNINLFESCKYAYEKGLELELNPDFKMLEADVVIHEELLKAALWVNFDEEFMNSKFTLEREGTIIFEKFIDKARLGIEFFLEMYKKIESINNIIIIKGARDVEYLPLKIPIDFKIINPKSISE